MVQSRTYDLFRVRAFIGKNVVESIFWVVFDFCEVGRRNWAIRYRYHAGKSIWVQFRWFTRQGDRSTKFMDISGNLKLIWRLPLPRDRCANFSIFVVYPKPISRAFLSWLHVKSRFSCDCLFVRDERKREIIGRKQSRHTLRHKYSSRSKPKPIKKPFELKYKYLRARFQQQSREKRKINIKRARKAGKRTKSLYVAKWTCEIGWNLKSVLIMEIKIISNLPHR